MALPKFTSVKIGSECSKPILMRNIYITIKSFEDIDRYIKEDVKFYNEAYELNIEITDVIVKNLFSNLEKFKQFAFDITTGEIIAAIDNNNDLLINIK